ncbi:cytochrome C oxidase: subunit VIb/COX12-like protein [Leptotrombidium deliense]|uniref:Cytochrome C oxidase: subunit VIb/COX12-like protein n=1 Tax=Leptotrombidium deliense TaxID=299467 RepID=A0A443SHQ7_9ACAR|nr:cytochrome C oxidase: subunit VIb/COX12-like protein [Leptotrombidium deliense]
MSYPTKESREKCWNSRDRYWYCLDNETEDKCKSLRNEFEKCCPQTWVKHFDRKRDYLKFQEKIESEGYDPLKKS